MQTVQSFSELIQRIRQVFLPVHQGWHVLRINPTSEANGDFLELVEAVLKTRKENEHELLEGLIQGCKEIDFSVSFKPRAETIHAKK